MPAADVPVEADADSEDAGADRKIFSLNAYADVETAYISRGYVWDARPYSAQYIEGAADMGAFGRVSAYAWSMSALSGSGHSTPMRRAYNEVDYGLRYAYTFKLTDNWSYTQGAAKQWVTNPGVRHGGHSLIDWQAFGALDNPYVVPYWRLRYIRRPYQAAYWCVGARKGFEITDTLLFTIDFFGDLGDARHFRHLFGPKPGHEESNYHGGLHSLGLVLRLDWKVVEHVGVYAFVGQLCTVSEDAREAIKASSAKEAKRDLTYGGVGLALDF